MKIDNNLKNIFDSLYDGILIIDKSGIVVYVNPSYTRITKIDKEDIELLETVKDKNAIILINKSDKELKVGIEDIKKYSNKDIIIFSAKENIGVDELEDMIKAKFISKEINFNDQVIITNIRHQEIINETLESMEMCISSIDEGYEEDFFTIDLLNAYEALGEIIGETVDDDVVNEIFSKFCMGK